MRVTFQMNGLKEFESKIKQHPEVVKRNVANFIKRITASYMRTIINRPWSVNSSGGGAPVSTGYLRDSHAVGISPWESFIKPLAPYAKYVHGVDGFSRKASYKLRPWLDYAVDANEKKLVELENELVDNIIKELV
jgi:hypothetical protein